MAEELITKRLHIAGLNPNITAQDLKARFASFGEVLALDGLGKLDGAGRPRPYVYLTLRTTPSKLKRVLSLLSGTTYKGAKLRIGEARPDWKEAWEKERAEFLKAEEQGGKKRRGERVEGKEAERMDVVTPENVKDRPYWRLTALNHLIRPLRMRPLHPLPPPASSSSSTISQKAGKAAKPSKRKRELEPPTRARRVVIDPTRWGAVHLTGELLEGAAVLAEELPERGVLAREGSGDEVGDRNGDEGRDASESEASSGSENEMRKGKKRKAAEAELDTPAQPTQRTKAKRASPPPQQAPSTPAPTPTAKPKPVSTATSASAPADPLDAALRQENSKTLDLLKQMFGETLEKAEKWADIDEEDGVPQEELVARRGDVAADVAMGVGQKGQEAEEEKEEEEDTDDGEEEEEGAEAEAEAEQKDVEMNDPADEEGQETDDTASESAASSSSSEEPAPPTPAPQTAQQPKESLKDLFAPHEDTGGFTLGLELDDLDDDPTLAPAPLAPATTVQSNYPQSTLPAYTPQVPASKEADYPLFFPPFDEDGKPLEIAAWGRRKVKGLWDVAREKGWADWPRETEDEARLRWEKVRGQLTQEWKKRAREARRRRKGTGLAGAVDVL